MTKSTEQIQQLVDRLIDFTKSPQSRLYYQKAILHLGIGRVEEAMGEVRMRIQEGNVDDKARYLTTVLKNWIDESDGPQSDPVATDLVVKSNLALFDTEDLFATADSEGEEGEIRTVTLPFSKKVLQWARPITNDFFALLPVKERFDKIDTRIKVNGEVFLVPLVRGKRSQDDQPNGVLTVEHARILTAIEHLWAKESSTYEVINQKPLLTCTVRIRDIAAVLGMKHFGGRDHKRIVSLLYDLERTGYYFDLKLLPSPLEDCEFRFLDKIKIYTMRRDDGKRETMCQFHFSDTYSSLFLNRKVVSRPLSMLHIDTSIGWKLYQYLYPILIRRDDSRPYRVALLSLIDILQCPQAGWHKFKSKRKQVFGASVREINGKETTDERIFSLQIVGQRSDLDYILEARLIQQIH